MPAKTSRAPGITKQNINFWAMMNNVILASLGKGQLLPVLLFFAFILMVLKMPSADVSQLMFAILSGLETGKLLGYVLSAGLTGGWLFHVRWQRRNYEFEMRRVAEKRDEIQEKALPGLIESSAVGKKKKKQ